MIEQYPSSALEIKCAPIEFDKHGDLPSDIEDLILDLIESMKEAGGVGIAAPQIGWDARIIVTSWEDKIRIFINPEIELSGHRIWNKEGCLSIPDIMLPTERSEKVLVKCMSLTGVPREYSIEGFEAIIVQHEFDHIEGITIIDRWLSHPNRDEMMKNPEFAAIDLELNEKLIKMQGV